MGAEGCFVCSKQAAAAIGVLVSLVEWPGGPRGGVTEMRAATARLAACLAGDEAV